MYYMYIIMCKNFGHIQLYKITYCLCHGVGACELASNHSYI